MQSQLAIIGLPNVRVTNFHTFGVIYTNYPIKKELEAGA
jgi:hypothetical protein